MVGMQTAHSIHKHNETVELTKLDRLHLSYLVNYFCQGKRLNRITSNVVIFVFSLYNGLLCYMLLLKNMVVIELLNTTTSVPIKWNSFDLLGHSNHSELRFKPEKRLLDNLLRIWQTWWSQLSSRSYKFNPLPKIRLATVMLLIILSCKY